MHIRYLLDRFGVMDHSQQSAQQSGLFDKLIDVGEVLWTVKMLTDIADITVTPRKGAVSLVADVVGSIFAVVIFNYFQNPMEPPQEPEEIPL